MRRFEASPTQGDSEGPNLHRPHSTELDRTTTYVITISSRSWHTSSILAGQAPGFGPVQRA